MKGYDFDVIIWSINVFPGINNQIGYKPDKTEHF